MNLEIRGGKKSVHKNKEEIYLAICKQSSAVESCLAQKIHVSAHLE